MKLGTKVKCKGYLSKLKTKHVESAYRENPTDYFFHMISIKIEDEISQKIYEIEKLEFEGIVVARKRIAIARHYQVCNKGWIEEDLSEVRVSPCDYIDCYQVFFRMGGSRLVPVELCEVMG